MNLAQGFQNLINQPTPTALVVALGVSGLVLVIGCALLLAGRWRWVGLGICVVSLLASLAVLFIVDQQTVTYRESQSVSVTRPRYPEQTRSLARTVLLTMPVVAALVALVAWVTVRRRLRRSVPKLLKAGRMHLFTKEYGPAQDAFSRAVRIAPYLAEAYCGLGMAYQGLGDPQRALAEFDRAIEYDPRTVPAFIQRARIRSESGDLDGALADLGRVMELQPSDPELYLNRGICLYKKGLLLEAATDFHRVLRLTNHSDFAEPAKDFLRRLDGQSADASAPASLMPPQANGVTESTAIPEPKTGDYIL
jgi:tetratricopeptide (TPR) repeat protein